MCVCVCLGLICIWVCLFDVCMWMCGREISVFVCVCPFLIQVQNGTCPKLNWQGRKESKSMTCSSPLFLILNYLHNTGTLLVVIFFHLIGQRQQTYLTDFFFFNIGHISMKLSVDTSGMERVTFHSVWQSLCSELRGIRAATGLIMTWMEQNLDSHPMISRQKTTTTNTFRQHKC